MTSFQSLVANWFGVAPGAARMVVDGVNKNVRIMRDQDDVFARFSPTSLHSRDDLESEAALLAALDEQGVPCCQLVYIDRACVLGPVFVDGIEYNVLLNRAIPGPALATNREDAAAFGRSLAQLHRSRVDKPVPKVPSETESDIHPTLQPVFRELIDLAEELPSSSRPLLGVCHGDAWLGNAINRDGTAVLFDFEFAGPGPLAYDIATFIWALRAGGNDEEELIFTSFVEGYRAEYDISFDQDQLNVNLLHKEINNIRFLCENIAMTREVKLATAQFARDTLNFVLSGGISRFHWD